MIIIENKTKNPINNRISYLRNNNFFLNINKIIIPFMKINKSNNNYLSTSNKPNLNLKKILIKEIN